MPRLVTPCALGIVVGLATSSACAFPRRATPLSPLSLHEGAPRDAPAHLWQLVVVEGEVPPSKRGGLPWDEQRDPPDPFVRVFVRGQEVWQSPTAENTDHPMWQTSPERNLAIERDERIRFEVWDQDAISSDPIGSYEGRALGNTLVGTDTILQLGGGATLTVRLQYPRPHVGTGIALYELRQAALVILEVLPNSPAARAGLAPGDKITAIDDRLIDELGPNRAQTGLTLAAQRQSELTVEAGGKFRKLRLDQGYVWLSTGPQK